jgi:predicted porin
MKKTSWICLLTASSGIAHAQSSVSLYGVVDNGLQYTNNQGGKTSLQMSQGGIGSSKWGITGVEDLGAGTQALFKLENGFDPNKGTLGNREALFGRQAYVGLVNSFGELRIGHQYDLLFDALVPLSASGRFSGGLGAHAGDVDNVWGDFNLDNTVKYLSPSYRGVRLGALYAFGNVPGSLPKKRTLNFSLTYNSGPIALAAAYLRVNDPALSVWGATSEPVAGQPYSNPLSSPIFSGYASASSLQVIGAGGSYRLASSSLGLLYTHTTFSGVVATSSTPFAGDAQFNIVEFNYTYNVTPGWLIAGAYSYTWAEQARYGQLNLGTSYLLSKRTNLYWNAVWQRASGTNSLGVAAVAANTNITASNTANQVAMRVGIRHSF